MTKTESFDLKSQPFRQVCKSSKKKDKKKRKRKCPLTLGTELKLCRELNVCKARLADQ